MILKLDKKDVNRVVEKYYKNKKRLNVKSEFGLIYDIDTDYVYPYIKIYKKIRNIIQSNYLSDKEFNDILSYTYNCNIKNISFDKANEIELDNINNSLYGIILDIKKIKN